MSDWKCEVVTVGPVTVHPNADRLAIAKAWDYDCVVGLGFLAEGDKAVYLPEGSIVPKAILDLLGGIRLAGNNYDRVKATKIRGVLSQGILLDQANIDVLAPGTILEEGQDLAELLGIKKWDPETEQPGGSNRPRILGDFAYYCPEKVFSFDVENIKKTIKFWTDGEPVSITEKLHGTFVQINVFPDGEIVIASKGLANRGQAYKITPETEVSNIYLRLGLPIARRVLAFKPQSKITVMGEIYGKGIQDLTYELPVPEFACFDIAIDHKILPPLEAQMFCLDKGIAMVPVIPQVWRFNREKIQELAESPSHHGGLREGVVVRSKNGSKLAKFINPAYLLRKNATEFN